MTTLSRHMMANYPALFLAHRWGGEVRKQFLERDGKMHGMWPFFVGCYCGVFISAVNIYIYRQLFCFFRVRDLRFYVTFRKCRGFLLLY